tara:strand:+ start:88 stop:675 length:588 start_codon:yes stop_codon:yes gene_type:complete
MKVDIENFIGVFENAIEDKWCDQVIKWYNFIEDKNPELILDRQSFEGAHPLAKNNNFLFMDKDENPNVKKLYNHFIDILNTQLFPLYNKKYPIISPENIFPKEVKVQKTSFEEGFHIWHYENANIENSKRVLVYMVYLNDIAEGGETEFLHQRKRIKPKKGTILLFPPYFTHTHRGNPPLSNEKYAITGWMCLKT